MTASKKARKPFDKNRVASDAEVARFLRNLAALYRDKRTGNRALADGLKRVADKLNHDSQSPPYPTNDPQTSFSTKPTLDELQRLDSDAITRFIADEAKSKSELIDLASARFSIPKANLSRLNLAGVRDAILASLRHEESLKIITKEAERNGATRRS